MQHPNMHLIRSETTNSSDSSAVNSHNDEYVEEECVDQLFFITSYTDFDKLAHGPRGTEANQSIYIYRFQPSDGSMLLLNKIGKKEEVTNPAFTRFHPRLDVVYTCTESCHEHGKIIAYKINADGSLDEMGRVDAGGTSTCYLTIDHNQKNMLAVNYWNSTLSVIPLNPINGNFEGPLHSIYDPKEGMGIKAAPKKDGGVNHSHNDENTIKARQADPHSHALVLDRYVGAVAYVPDLGKDLIREFYYNKKKASIDMEIGFMPSGLCTGHPDGPRYFEFHPRFDIAYVVNELSSTIAVFSVDRKLLQEIDSAAVNNECLDRFKGKTTLTLIQSIKTVPSAFSTTMNTCGRICVHKNGRFVIVSNRGHESLAIFRVKSNGPQRGQLSIVGYFHTRGETPRHFQFDSSGQFLIVANQDTDSISVFNFNMSSGEIKFTGNEYRVPSPNFVCSCPVRGVDNLTASIHPAYNGVLSVQGVNTIMRSENRMMDSDLEESDGSTMTVDDAEVLQKQLQEALQQVEDLKLKLTRMNCGSAELKH